MQPRGRMTRPHNFDMHMWLAQSGGWPSWRARSCAARHGLAPAPRARSALAGRRALGRYRHLQVAADVDHVAQDGSNKIAISAHTDDVDALVAAMASPPPEVLARMQEHGVIPPLTVYVER